MQLQHYLTILCTPILSPAFFSLSCLALPPSAVTPACICAFQPATTVHLSWIDRPEDLLRFAAETHSLQPSSLSLLQGFKLSEGPPSEDKGTPGNRGGCRYNQCSATQIKESNPRTPHLQENFSVNNPGS